MINVCAHCGSYRPDKEIQQNPSRAICPDCGHGHPFVQRPLLLFADLAAVGKRPFAASCQGTPSHSFP